MTYNDSTRMYSRIMYLVVIAKDNSRRGIHYRVRAFKLPKHRDVLTVLLNALSMLIAYESPRTVVTRQSSLHLLSTSGEDATCVKRKFA